MFPSQMYQPNEIRLLDYQVPHFQSIIYHLQANRFYMDASGMGLGKTYVTCAVAKQMRLVLFVLCPKSVKNKWYEVSVMYGIPFVVIDTYESMPGTRGRQELKYPYLTREDREGSEGRVTTRFYSTQHWTNLLQQGILLVLDESQKVKNEHAMYHAVRVLVQQTIHVTSPSRIVALTGTPFDDFTQALNFMYMFGLVSTRQLFRKSESLVVTPTGFNEIVGFAHQLQPDETQRVIRASGGVIETPEGYKHLASEIFAEVISPHYLFEMPPQDLGVPLDKKNLFIQITDDRRAEELEKLGRKLANSVRYRADKDEAEVFNLQAVMDALRGIGRVIAWDVGRIVRSHLQRYPMSKVVIFVFYHDAADIISTVLDQYRPVRLMGNVPDRERDQIVQRWHHDPNFRVMITNPVVGGLGIDLEDRTGFHETLSIIIPDYRLGSIQQSVYRTYRPNVKSKVTIRILYGIVGCQSLIMRAMFRKSRNMRRYLRVQREHGVLFPDEYPNLYEGAQGSEILDQEYDKIYQQYLGGSYRSDIPLRPPPPLEIGTEESVARESVARENAVRESVAREITTPKSPNQASIGTPMASLDFRSGTTSPMTPRTAWKASPFSQS